nr:GNAT family N-acetyltransferase [Pantoea stewartii]
MLNKNPQWGTYINSLHVSSELRGQGAGKKIAASYSRMDTQKGF